VEDSVSLGSIISNTSALTCSSLV